MHIMPDCICTLLDLWYKSMLYSPYACNRAFLAIPATQAKIEHLNSVSKNITTVCCDAVMPEYNSELKF